MPEAVPDAPPEAVDPQAARAALQTMGRMIFNMSTPFQVFAGRHQSAGRPESKTFKPQACGM
jgi:hypothetical protein